MFLFMVCSVWPSFCNEGFRLFSMGDLMVFFKIFGYILYGVCKSYINLIGSTVYFFALQFLFSIQFITDDKKEIYLLHSDMDNLLSNLDPFFTSVFLAHWFYYI